MAKPVIKPGAHLRFGCQSINLEAPCEIREGLFDIGSIGAFSYLGGGASVIRHTASIGRFCSIAPNVSIGLTEHPTHFLSSHHVFEGGGVKQLDSEELRTYRQRNMPQIEHASARWQADSRNQKIIIGNDVWIGEGAMIRRGVTIGDGAVIAAKSVVTRSVEPYAIVAGTPARRIKMRFAPEVVSKLLALNWTAYGLACLQGADITDPFQAVVAIEKNLASGLELYRPKTFVFNGKLI